MKKATAYETPRWLELDAMFTVPSGCEEVEMTLVIKKQVVIRLDRDLVKRIEHIAVEWDDFRGAAIERLLTIAVEQVEKQPTI